MQKVSSFRDKFFFARNRQRNKGFFQSLIGRASEDPCPRRADGLHVRGSQFTTKKALPACRLPPKVFHYETANCIVRLELSLALVHVHVRALTDRERIYATTCVSMGDRRAVAHAAVQWAFQGSPTIGSSSVRHREKLSVVDNLSGMIAIENRATMESERGHERRSTST